MEKPKTHQQSFLHAFAQRHLVSQKVIHKSIDDSLGYLEGSFANLALKDAYLTFCLENNIDLEPEDYNVLKMMISWAEYYPKLRSQPSFPITEAVFHGNDLSSFRSLEDFISYLSFITPDIIKLIKRREQGDESSRKESERYNFEKIGAE